MGKRVETYKNKKRLEVYKRLNQLKESNGEGVKRIKVADILNIVEDVLKDVFKLYDVFKEKECNCEPDMDAVKQIALQEGMTTHEILRLCSQISAAGKGQYGK